MRFTRPSSAFKFAVLLSLWIYTPDLWAGPSGGGHYRLRVTPDYDTPGLSLISEFNVYGGALYTNAMVDYLTEEGWDIGINTFNIPVAGTASANGKQYDTFLNVTKFFFRPTI